MNKEVDWWMTGLKARFFIVDARVSCLIPPMMLHMTFATIGIFAGSIFFLYLLERRGYTPEVAFRIMRLRIASMGNLPLRIHRPTSLWSWRNRSYQ